jgi:lysophospholipase L1-like esterase
VFLGISASQIVHDIDNMKSREPRRLEKFLKEWQAKRRRWKQLQDLKVQHRHSNLPNNDDDDSESETLNNFFRKWWNSDEKLPLSDIGDSIERIARDWWKRTTTRVKEDLSDIKDMMRVTSSDDSDEEGVDGHTISHHSTPKLVRKGNIFRRNSLDPVVASQYDIAVVLLGLNDLKDAFMPHMTMGPNASIGEGTEAITGGLNHQLQGVLQALQKKMGKMDLPSSDDSFSVEKKNKKNESKEKLKPPLVVVPELPVAPLEAFQLVPLCWFLLPLFRAMESNKKFLSSTFPEDVVFVHQPDLKWWSDVQSGISPIHKNLKEEESLLRLTDIAQTAQKKVQQLMKKFYDPDNQSGETDERKHGENETPNDVLTLKEGRQGNPRQSESQIEKSFGSQKLNETSYIALDKMHPNDEGYEIWGRHIAAAVVRHWNS